MTDLLPDVASALAPLVVVFVALEADGEADGEADDDADRLVAIVTFAALSAEVDTPPAGAVTVKVAVTVVVFATGPYAFCGERLGMPADDNSAKRVVKARY